ncbi:hypothetical protein TNCV_4880821 [Trichonephila clavipes]|nr:hypothetical protein TNCV_4880821 [Trichonephila clavipes]
MLRAHQAGFSRRSLAGVRFLESVRSYGPGLALLTNATKTTIRTSQIPVIKTDPNFMSCIMGYCTKVVDYFPILQCGKT